MGSNVLILSTLCVVVLLQIVSADTRCGTLSCRKMQYCSAYHQKCEDCSNICEGHNADQRICERDCQDYLLEKREKKVEELREHVRHLENMINVSLGLAGVSIVGILLVALVVFVNCIQNKNVSLSRLRDYFNKKKVKNISNGVQQKNHPSTVTVNMGKPEDLRLEMPAIPPHSPAASDATTVGIKLGDSPGTMMTTTTTMSRRSGPAEDRAPDYAYDNPALARTPTPH